MSAMTAHEIGEKWRILTRKAALDSIVDPRVEDGKGDAPVARQVKVVVERIMTTSSFVAPWQRPYL